MRVSNGMNTWAGVKLMRCEVEHSACLLGCAGPLSVWWINTRLMWCVQYLNNSLWLKHCRWLSERKISDTELYESTGVRLIRGLYAVRCAVALYTLITPQLFKQPYCWITDCCRLRATSCTLLYTLHHGRATINTRLARPAARHLQEVTNTRNVRGEVGRKFISGAWDKRELGTIFQQPGTRWDAFKINFI